MKKLTTLILIGLVCATVWGQTNKIELTGNVGIGTTSPSARLTTIQNGTIGGKNLANAGLLVGTTSNGIGIDNNEIVKKGGGGLNFQSIDTPINFFTGYETSSFRMTILPNGYVGIGTTTPNATLSVEGGNLYVGEKVTSNGTRRELRIYGYDNGEQFYGSFHSNYDNTRRTLDISSNLHTQQIKIDASSNAYGRILLMPGEDIGVGIGTIDPKAKLDVAGNIKAHEIEVTLASMQDLQLNGTLAANNITYTANGNTADFVFEDNYHLKDLSEVEAFIKANKHLPEIPSAAEMEMAGVNLAEMNKLLLMKVEELTLYSIELEKEVKRQKAEVEKVESLELKVEELSEDRRRVTELEERLAKLEALVTQ